MAAKGAQRSLFDVETVHHGTSSRRLAENGEQALDAVHNASAYGLYAFPCAFQHRLRDLRDFVRNNDATMS